MDAELKLLMVEDLIYDADLIKHEISRNGINIIDLIVDTKEDYVKAIYDFKPDFILSDYSLPSFNGNIWKSEFLNRKKDKTVFWENVVISPLLKKRKRHQQLYFNYGRCY